MRKHSTFITQTLDSKTKAEPKRLSRVLGVPMGLEGNKMKFAILWRGRALRAVQGF